MACVGLNREKEVGHLLTSAGTPRAPADASGLTAEGAIRLSDCVPVFPAGELRHG